MQRHEITKHTLSGLNKSKRGDFLKKHNLIAINAVIRTSQRVHKQASWIKLFDSIHDKKHPRCARLGCTKAATVGGHVHILSKGHDLCSLFIIPLCTQDNSRFNTEPFALKAAIHPVPEQSEGNILNDVRGVDTPRTINNRESLLLTALTHLSEHVNGKTKLKTPTKA